MKAEKDAKVIGSMLFNPKAKLDTSQITDVRNKSKKQEFEIRQALARKMRKR